MIVRGTGDPGTGRIPPNRGGPGRDVPAPRPVRRFDILLAADTPDDARPTGCPPTVPSPRVEAALRPGTLPDYLKVLKRADFAALRRDSDRAFARVLAEFADIVPAALSGGQPARETLADLSPKASCQPGPPADPAPEPRQGAGGSLSGRGQDGQPGRGERPRRRPVKAGPGVPACAYIAAAPKWSDYGPKMWAIAEASPRSLDAFDALLWITQPGPHAFLRLRRGARRPRRPGRRHPDPRPPRRRSATHLDGPRGRRRLQPLEPDTGSAHRPDLPGALRTRPDPPDVRGRMGFMLWARHRKAEAELRRELRVPARGRLPIDALRDRHLPSLLPREPPPGRPPPDRRGGRDSLREGQGRLRQRDLSSTAEPSTGETLADRRRPQELAEHPDPRASARSRSGDRPARTSTASRWPSPSSSGRWSSSTSAPTSTAAAASSSTRSSGSTGRPTYKTRPFAALGINNRDRLEILKQANSPPRRRSRGVAGGTATTPSTLARSPLDGTSEAIRPSSSSTIAARSVSRTTSTRFDPAVRPDDRRAHQGGRGRDDARTKVEPLHGCAVYLGRSSPRNPPVSPLRKGGKEPGRFVSMLPYEGTGWPASTPAQRNPPPRSRPPGSALRGGRGRPRLAAEGRRRAEAFGNQGGSIRPCQTDPGLDRLRAFPGAGDAVWLSHPLVETMEAPARQGPGENPGQERRGQERTDRRGLISQAFRA